MSGNFAAIAAAAFLAQAATDTPVSQEIEGHRRFIEAFTGAGTDGDQSNLGPRSSRAERAAARAFITAALERHGLEVKTHRYAHPNLHPMLDLFLPPMRGINLYAEVMATEPSDQYVIVGGHYDTERGSPGADDNATGVAATLSVAKRIAKLPQRDVNFLFVFFDQEEDDMSPGSKMFARHVRDQGYAIHSMHNIDMIGWDGDGDRVVEVEVPNEEIKALYTAAAAARGLGLTFVRFDSSDHLPFREMGIASVCLGEEVFSGDLNPNYHSPTDTIEHIDFEYLSRATLMIGDVMVQLGRPQ